MGNQVRLSPDGPRDLEESDYDLHTEKPKVIRNPESSQITGPAHFEPIEDSARHEQLVKTLDKRGEHNGASRVLETQHRTL